MDTGGAPLRDMPIWVWIPSFYKTLGPWLQFGVCVRLVWFDTLSFQRKRWNLVLLMQDPVYNEVHFAAKMTLELTRIDNPHNFVQTMASQHHILDKIASSKKMKASNLSIII